MLEGYSQLSANEQLDQFLSRASTGPFGYPDCHHFQGAGAHGQHTVLGFVTHGNEHGSLPAALALQASLLRTAPPGPVTLLLGNVEAARADQRFLEEDFNRVFTFDRPAESKERKRAALLRPLLDSADVFLDFHQTQTPTTSAFYTFPWSSALANWARLLAAAPVGLTRAPGQVFSKGLRCLDEYVRDQGKVGLTVETGYRGQDAEQAALVHRTAQRLLRAVEQTASGKDTLHALATEHPPITWYTTKHIVHTSSPKMRLKPGLSNWSQVAKGETLSSEDSPAFSSPISGRALFPKYPTPKQAPPPELVRIACPLEDPESLS